MNHCVIKLTLGFMLFVQYSDLTFTSHNRRYPMKLLLILFDGFRWDYVKDMEGFNEMKRIGVHADYLIPVFPSMSFPNYYSLVTGLYTEHHGMIMNYMYDVNRDNHFLMLPNVNSSYSYWWEEAEPFWATAIKNNRKTALYYWPDGHENHHGVQPSFSLPYKFTDDLRAFRGHLDDALQDLKDNTIDVALIYSEYIDFIGHTLGPDSHELKSAVKDVDKEIQELISNLHRFKLIDKVNVIIVSDHGMVSTDDQHVKRISLEKYLNKNQVEKLLGEGAVVGVYPLRGYFEKVYADLQQGHEFHVWKRSDIPEKFHIKNNNRTPPILVLAKRNYYILGLEETNKQIPYRIKEEKPPYKGYDGYNVDEVPDMRGIFFGFGPGFEKNKKIEKIHIVDIYNIMMHMLDLGHLPNNGTWSSVFNLCKSDYVNGGASSVWYEGVAGVLTCVGGIYIYSLIVIAHSWV